MTTQTDPPTIRRRIAELAGQRISAWQRGYLNDEAGAVAALARLRRGAGREAGQLPDLWELVDTTALHQPPEGARPLSEKQMTKAEDALHIVMTVWAVHQQARGSGMHQPALGTRPNGLGAAVRQLMKPGEINEPLRKRLVRAGTAPDTRALAQRLRDLVVLLRTQDIPLDYGLLAGQLYTWQQPGGADTVRREWGRSFHSGPRSPHQETAPPAPASGEPAASTSSSTFDKDAS